MGPLTVWPYDPQLQEYTINSDHPLLNKIKVLSYKYKMFREEEEEGETYNSYCMCTLDNSNRSLATFTISAPDTGTYFLKLYAVPEEELSETKGGIFNFLASFKITFTKVCNRYWIRDAFEKPLQVGLNLLRKGFNKKKQKTCCSFGLFSSFWTKNFFLIFSP